MDSIAAAVLLPDGTTGDIIVATAGLMFDGWGKLVAGWLEYTDGHGYFATTSCLSLPRYILNIKAFSQPTLFCRS